MEGLAHGGGGQAALGSSIPLPLELRAFKNSVEGYVAARLKQFAGALTRRHGMDLTTAQLDLLVSETMASVAAADKGVGANARVLRLVLRHDCQSTGCGEPGCMLCQYNPSRLCKRNLKTKYLIDDHLRSVWSDVFFTTILSACPLKCPLAHHVSLLMGLHQLRHAFRAEPASVHVTNFQNQTR